MSAGRNLISVRDAKVGPTCGECGNGHKLLADGLCFDCRQWRDRVLESQSGRSLRVDGHYYQVKSESWALEATVKMGGYMVAAYDGRLFLPAQLEWHGPIPVHFRGRLPDNAAMTYQEWAYKIDEHCYDPRDVMGFEEEATCRAEKA